MRISTKPQAPMHALNHPERPRVEQRGLLRYVSPVSADVGSVLPPEGEARVRSDDITRAVEHVLGSCRRDNVTSRASACMISSRRPRLRRDFTNGRGAHRAGHPNAPRSSAHAA